MLWIFFLEKKHMFAVFYSNLRRLSGPSIGTVCVPRPWLVALEALASEQPRMVLDGRVLG